MHLPGTPRTACNSRRLLAGQLRRCPGAKKQHFRRAPLFPGLEEQDTTARHRVVLTGYPVQRQTCFHAYVPRCQPWTSCVHCQQGAGSCAAFTRANRSLTSKWRRWRSCSLHGISLAQVLLLSLSVGANNVGWLAITSWSTSWVRIDVAARGYAPSDKDGQQYTPPPGRAPREHLSAHLHVSRAPPCRRRQYFAQHGGRRAATCRHLCDVQIVLTWHR